MFYYYLAVIATLGFAYTKRNRLYERISKSKGYPKLVERSSKVVEAFSSFYKLVQTYQLLQNRSTQIIPVLGIMCSILLKKNVFEYVSIF